MSSFFSSATIVGSEGPRTASIALVGESLGTQEVRMHRPFVGPAGQFLDRCLKSAGLSRRELYITNVIKEQPYNNDASTFIDLSKKLPQVSPEAEIYIKLLQEELTGISANILVALGNIALWVLTGQSQITKRRGSVYPSILVPGKKVIGCIHPSAALRQDLFKYAIIHDLKRALHESEFQEIRNAELPILLNPSYSEALEFLISLHQDSNITAIDIEVFNEEVSCISLGNKNHGYICIPFIGDDDDCFSSAQEAEIWLAIARICEDSRITKIGQNITFDATFLFRRLGIIMR